LLKNPNHLLGCCGAWRSLHCGLTLKWGVRHGNDDYRKAGELVQGLGVSDERVSALIRETLGLVEQHWARIERFAEVLLERGTLQGDEIDAQFAD